MFQASDMEETFEAKQQQSNGKAVAASSTAAAPAPAMEAPENSNGSMQLSKGKTKAASSSAEAAAMSAPESSKRQKQRSTDKKDGASSSVAAAVIAALSQRDVAVGGPFGRWPELNEELLATIVGLLHSLRDVSAAACVCRPWRAYVRSSRPAAGRPPLLIRPILRCVDPFPNRRRRSIRQNRWIAPRRCELLCPAAGASAPPRRSLVSAEVLSQKFLGVSHGHIIFVSGDNRFAVAVDPFTGLEIRPPPLPREKITFNLGTLTAPISSPDCKLILSATNSVFFLWGIGDENWTIHSLMAVDVIDTGISVFWDIIQFKDQIFAFDYESRLFALSFSPELSIKQLPVEWEGGVPCPAAINGSQFLVECDGELMVVQATPMEVFVFWTFYVYRLDLTSRPPVWKKVHDLGDWSLFVGSRSAVACEFPGRWGGRSNCIYYIGRGCETWYEFCLDGGAPINAVDPAGPFHHSKAEQPLWPSALWVYPTRL